MGSDDFTQEFLRMNLGKDTEWTDERIEANTGIRFPTLKRKPGENKVVTSIDTKLETIGSARRDGDDDLGVPKPNTVVANF